MWTGSERISPGDERLVGSHATSHDRCRRNARSAAPADSCKQGILESTIVLAAALGTPVPIDEAWQSGYHMCNRVPSFRWKTLTMSLISDTQLPSL